MDSQKLAERLPKMYSDDIILMGFYVLLAIQTVESSGEHVQKSFTGMPYLGRFEQQKEFMSLNGLRTNEVFWKRS